MTNDNKKIKELYNLAIAALKDDLTNRDIKPETRQKAAFKIFDFFNDDDMSDFIVDEMFKVEYLGGDRGDEI